MICVICDRCGRIIRDSEKIGYVGVNWREEGGGNLTKENPYQDWDICEICMEEIVDVIDKRGVSAPEEWQRTERRRKDLDPEKDDQDQEEETEEEEGEAEELEEEQEEPVGRLADTPKPSHGVNLRELRELVKAGNKPKEIAEHFGITVASFYNYRKRAEALWNAGRL